MATLITIHAGLAQTGVYFFVILGLWALVQRLRSRPLEGNWYGAAVIGEGIMLAQFIVGWTLYSQGLGANLPRALVHILYGTVGIITLPAAYAYFSRLEDENIKSVLFAIICFFLMGVVLRAKMVAIG